MCADKTKRVLLSGIQPSGHLTIGNYIGAIRNWVALQDAYDCLFVLVDLHAITVRQDPAELRQRCYEFLALYVACGIDPDKNAVFVQSHVPGHAQLAWVLNCFTSMGELTRMHQYKEKATRQGENVTAGLFDYPVLMAADILLYATDLVPVGEDQKQHLELTRDVAMRFNGRYGQVFTVPEPYIPEVGARIMSLQDPTAKMSKSDPNAGTYVALLDEPDVVRRKIKRAQTDSGSEIVHDESKPAISNLLTIHAGLTGETIGALEDRYRGAGYGRFKTDLADVIVEALAPIQERYHAIVDDRAGLADMLARGADAARRRSHAILTRVHDALGFIEAGTTGDD